MDAGRESPLSGVRTSMSIAVPAGVNVKFNRGELRSWAGPQYSKDPFARWQKPALFAPEIQA
ncbi:hypothetical protein ACNKHK_03335 [Shigella flexneri]